MALSSEPRGIGAAAPCHLTISVGPEIQNPYNQTHSETSLRHMGTGGHASDPREEGSPKASDLTGLPR